MSDSLPTRPDAIAEPVAIERLVALIMARSESTWTEAIRAVLVAHVGRVLASPPLDFGGARLPVTAATSRGKEE